MNEQDARMWQAVLDRQSDDSFVYAVRTTGIYCRPSCPARRPQRANVAYYAGPAEAAEAGFRPCLRCNPAEAAPSLVERACRHIEAHLDTPLTLPVLGAALGFSPTHLQRIFKRETGVSPRQYAESLRLARAKAQLRAGEDVTTAVYEAGFGSASRLYERSAGELGMTPGTYKRGGVGMTIHYTVAPCALGRLLVAATDRGLAAVAFGDEEAGLLAELAAEYPRATLLRDQTGLEGHVAAIAAALQGRPLPEEVTLDVPGTAFQRRVWEALRRIPAGTTVSYGELARSLGQPTATRAVARACATNRVALVIPCHRVIREDGSLGGYRWGLERKRALLEGERER